MASHLIGSYLVVGQITRAEVLQLLGEPERECRDGCLNYPLGVCGGSDYRFLLVCFDDNGKLTRAERRGGNLGGHSCVRADR